VGQLFGDIGPFPVQRFRLQRSSTPAADVGIPNRGLSSEDGNVSWQNELRVVTRSRRPTNVPQRKRCSVRFADDVAAHDGVGSCRHLEHVAMREVDFHIPGYSTAPGRRKPSGRMDEQRMSCVVDSRDAYDDYQQQTPTRCLKLLEQV